MKTHKVVDIKITYEPEHMNEGEEVEIEKIVNSFLESIKGRRGLKVKAKKHEVAVQTMIDDYGMGFEDQF